MLPKGEYLATDYEDIEIFTTFVDYEICDKIIHTTPTCCNGGVWRQLHR